MTFATLALAYLLGSIPFGLIVTRMAGVGDIRAIGSGNIGATNVMRAGNKKLAALTLLLDMGKGFLAVKAAQYVHDLDTLYMAAGLAAITGHIFPVWLKFKGGKGVATAIGILLAILPSFAICLIAVWLGVFLATRIAALASIIAFASGAPIGFFLYQSHIMALYAFLLTLVICYTHRGNIKRLLAGTEPSFRRNDS